MERCRSVIPREHRERIGNTRRHAARTTRHGMQTRRPGVGARLHGGVFRARLARSRRQDATQAAPNSAGTPFRSRLSRSERARCAHEAPRAAHHHAHVVYRPGRVGHRGAGSGGEVEPRGHVAQLGDSDSKFDDVRQASCATSRNILGPEDCIRREQPQ